MSEPEVARKRQTREDTLAQQESEFKPESS